MGNYLRGGGRVFDLVERVVTALGEEPRDASSGQGFGTLPQARGHRAEDCLCIFGGFSWAVEALPVVIPPWQLGQR